MVLIRVVLTVFLGIGAIALLVNPARHTARATASPSRLGDSAPFYVDVEDLAGTWQSANGPGISIVMKDIDTHTLTLKETYDDWSGAYTPVITGSLMLGRVSSEQPLIFTRAPTADQMADPTSEAAGVGAPLWARQKVEGKLKWSLELRLQAGAEPGEILLVGDFYPGSIYWREETDVAGLVTREARVAGKGTPRKVEYHAFDDGDG